VKKARIQYRNRVRPKRSEKLTGNQATEAISFPTAEESARNCCLSRKSRTGPTRRVRKELARLSRGPETNPVQTFSERRPEQTPNAARSRRVVIRDIRVQSTHSAFTHGSSRSRPWLPPASPSQCGSFSDSKRLLRSCCRYPFTQFPLCWLPQLWRHVGTVGVLWGCQAAAFFRRPSLANLRRSWDAQRASDSATHQIKLFIPPWHGVMSGIQRNGRNGPVSAGGGGSEARRFNGSANTGRHPHRLRR